MVIGKPFSLIILLLIYSSSLFATTDKIKITVVNNNTQQAVNDANVFVGNNSLNTDKNGQVTIKKSTKPVTIHVSYLHKKVRHIKTFHNITLKRDEIVLPVTDNSTVNLEANFSMSVPFGGVPADAKAVVLLPPLAFDTGGLNFGFYNGIRIYSDQLQNDNKISLMMVALDKNLIPVKYGYFLDQEPALLNQQILRFNPPFATGIVHSRQLLKWRKTKDAIDASDENSICDFSAPPYSKCGMRPQKGGIFSWINILRKKQLFHSPGAFLPSRTQGANPLLALPDSKIELVGHDDPLGFFPMNYARHRYIRFNDAPSDEIHIKMPEILVGFQGDVGSDALQFSEKNNSVQFEISSANKTSQIDLENIDWAKFETVWTNKKSGNRIIWHQIFKPNAGNNDIRLDNLPTALKEWQPTQTSEFTNVQVWIYGIDKIAGFDNAMDKIFSGHDPFQIGPSAFRVTRWR